MVGFSSIATSIAIIYDCPESFVVAQALIFFIAYIPSNFVVIYILSRYGLRSCLIIGSTLMLLGAWLRTLVTLTGNFEAIFLGTTIASLG